MKKYLVVWTAACVVSYLAHRAAWNYTTKVLFGYPDK